MFACEKFSPPKNIAKTKISSKVLDLSNLSPSMASPPVRRYNGFGIKCAVTALRWDGDRDVVNLELGRNNTVQAREYVR